MEWHTTISQTRFVRGFLNYITVCIQDSGFHLSPPFYAYACRQCRDSRLEEEWHINDRTYLAKSRLLSLSFSKPCLPDYPHDAESVIVMLSYQRSSRPRASARHYSCDCSFIQSKDDSLCVCSSTVVWWWCWCGPGRGRSHDAADRASSVSWLTRLLLLCWHNNTKPQLEYIAHKSKLLSLRNPELVTI